MGRTANWTGILGDAVRKAKSANRLAQWLGVSYSCLYRWSQDETKMPKLAHIALGAIIEHGEPHGKGHQNAEA